MTAEEIKEFLKEVHHPGKEDRDIVELSNLQRQVLFTERDAREQVPKAEAAKAHLAEMNHEVQIEAVIADVNPYNVEKFISDADLVIDGTDNLETRYLLNEACDKLKIRWIYGGVVGSGGTMMNILPGEGPCLECLMGPLPEPSIVAVQVGNARPITVRTAPRLRTAVRAILK